MNPERSSAALLVVAATGLLAVSGCTPYSTFKYVPIDCDVEKQYDLFVDPMMFTFDTVGDASRGWTANDGSPGALMAGQVMAIPGEPRCGSTAALVIAAARNNEWGSLFGFNNFAQDAADYEGLAF